MNLSFTKIANDIITDKKIDSNTYRVYSYIISLYNEEKGYSFPSMRTISDNIGISLTTVQKCIKKLKDLGYIQVEQIKSNANNTMNIYKNLKHLIKDVVKKVVETTKKVSKFVKEKAKKAIKTTRFTNYPQREYDYEKLEEEILGWWD